MFLIFKYIREIIVIFFISFYKKIKETNGRDNYKYNN